MFNINKFISLEHSVVIIAEMVIHDDLVALEQSVNEGTLLYTVSIKLVPPKHINLIVHIM